MMKQNGNFFFIWTGTIAGDGRSNPVVGKKRLSGKRSLCCDHRYLCEHRARTDRQIVGRSDRCSHDVEGTNRLTMVSFHPRFTSRWLTLLTRHRYNPILKTQSNCPEKFRG